MARRHAGFSLIELVAVVTVLGVLAAVALPRMGGGAYYAAEFHDRTVAALRFAQKTATSHRRQVCVSFPNSATISFQIAGSYGGACDTPLAVPGTASNQLSSKDPAGTFFNPVPAAWTFAADGTGADRSIGIVGAANPIIVAGASGYVQ